MRYLIAVFKSRTDGMEFGSNLARYGVASTAVNTPRSIGSSCTMSIRFPAGAVRLAQRVLAEGNYYSFIGFYNL